jgi:hypothetical protein
VQDALAAHRDYVMSETLASHWGEPPATARFECGQDEGALRFTVRLARDAAANG